MPEIDHLAVLADESRRFRDLLAGTDLAATVPSCPDWSGADLLWHLTEVQHFWSQIAGRLLDDPEEAEEIERPADADALLPLFDRASQALVEALREHDPADTCWSWNDDGRTVGWTRRRQAHEALIHRVDADLLASGRAGGIAADLAADGVDEVVGAFLGNPIPEWATFTPDGATIALESTDAPGRWTIAFGRFAGTSPRTGNTYDDDDATPCPDPGAAATTVRGKASDLDLWLWGRRDDEAFDVEGDPGLVRRLREVMIESTQ